jgi:TolA-binding protein
MKEYEPARVYFELVSTEYAQTVWAARAQYAIGESYEQEGKIREAVAAFEKLISEFGQDPMAVRARERIERLGAHRGG